MGSHLQDNVLDTIFDDIQDRYPTFERRKYDYYSGHGRESYYAAALYFLIEAIDTELKSANWYPGRYALESDWPDDEHLFQWLLREQSGFLECISDFKGLLEDILKATERRPHASTDSFTDYFIHANLITSVIGKLAILSRCLILLDYARIIDWHLAIFRLKRKATCIDRCRRQEAVESIQMLLDSSESHLTTNQREELEHLRCKAAKNDCILPSKFFIKGVQRPQFHPVGCGSYGDVYKGRAGGMDVAVKVAHLYCDYTKREVRLRDLYKEALIWRLLNNPYVLPFLGLCTEQFPSTGLVSPWMHNGHLLEYLKRNPDVDKYLMMKKISWGLSYLHSHDPEVVHGDLKCANILVDDSGNPQIADFGLARLTGVTTLTNSSSGSKGTLRWQAPELIFPRELGGDGRVNAKTDVYAFGMTCLEIHTEKQPFHDMTDWEVVSMAQAGTALQHALSIVQFSALYPVLKRCCATDPAARPAVEDIVFAFVSGGDYELGMGHFGSLLRSELISSVPYL